MGAWVSSMTLWGTKVQRGALSVWNRNFKLTLYAYGLLRGNDLSKLGKVKLSGEDDKLVDQDVKSESFVP